MKYEKPIAVIEDAVTENVYAASGGAGGSVCQSVWMQGVYHAPENAPAIGTEIERITRGCEGCPAAQGACRLDLGPFGTPLMPRWERAGYGPHDIYRYGEGEG